MKRKKRKLEFFLELVFLFFFNFNFNLIRDFLNVGNVLKLKRLFKNIKIKMKMIVF